MMTLRKKLIFILISVAILPMVFVGTLGYFSAQKALENERIEGLKSINYLKMKNIEDFFIDQKKHIRIAQRRPTIRKYSSMLAAFSGDFSSPFYQKICEELDRALNMYQPVYDYINVMLANPEGRIVYVLIRSLDLKDLNDMLPEPWGTTFEEGKKEVYLSNIFKNRNQTGQFSAYIAAPLRDFDGKFTGVIAIEIDMASIFKLVQDSTGMGASGETVIARKENNSALFLNPLRHDPDAALKRKIIFEQGRALPMQDALKANSGHGLSVDYRGKKVIAVWHYISALGWGIVSKIDASEVYEPAAELRNFVLLLGIAVIILSSLSALIVARSISEPILMLKKGTEEIGRGNLDHKVGTDGKNEVCQLGRAFDQMAEKLKTVTASRDELNREIDKRKKVEKELQQSMGELDERVKELNCLYEISRLVEQERLSLWEIIQGIADLIPPAWQYPEITCAKITIKSKEVKTSNYKETIWQQPRDIIIHGVPSGQLVVGYIEERPERVGSLFLAEEQALLDAIAERLGRIVERRWALDALSQSEEKNRELMENMSSGVIVYEAVADGKNFEFKDFNRGSEKIEHINIEEIAGRWVTDIFPEVRVSGIFDVLQRVWKTGRPEYFSGSMWQNHRTPSTWREGYVYKLSSGEIVSVYQDVTKQKLAQKAIEESEKRFRDLVENSLTGISIVQDGRIVYQNMQQEGLLGPLPRPVKFKDTESIHPDDAEKVNAFYQSISSGRLPTGAMDFRFYPPGEKAGRSNMKWVHSQANLIKYLGKDAILVNIMDMTKAKELEHLLTIQDKMASLGRVAAGIAHEIRNPLSGINIYLNTLQKLHHQKGSEEKVNQILGQIQSASRKIESVIRRVMDFAKPNEPRLALIDLNQPISEAIELSAVTMRKSGISLECSLAEDLPPCKADATLIEEMALNILNNAAEAMHTMEEGKKIRVTSSLQNDRIVFAVSDSGPGIPPEVGDNIFEPYVTTKSDGTGIGLSLCHRIVTDHGGTLTVLDSQWGGAEFRVEIPIKN